MVHAPFLISLSLHSTSWQGLPKGERMKLSEIQEQYGEEYYELTDEQKFELMEGLMDDRDTNFKGARLTSRGRLKTLSSVMQNIEKQVTSNTLHLSSMDSWLTSPLSMLT